MSLVPSSSANVNGAWPALVLGSPCLRKLAKLLDSIPAIALITWVDLRMLSEALASLTHDVQAPSSPGMYTILPAGPWAFRSWLRHHVDLSPGLLGSHLVRASLASWECTWEVLEWVWLCGPGHFWNSLQNACMEKYLVLNGKRNQGP